MFHAGGNIAGRWEDFREFSAADREYFQQLLPIEGLDFSAAEELAVAPPVRGGDGIDIRQQTGVLVQELPPLLATDEDARRAFDLLRDRGFTADDFRRMEELRPVPTTRVLERQARRAALDADVRNEVGRTLAARQLNPQGRDLDRQRRNRTNFVVLKAAVDRLVNSAVGMREGERADFTRQQLDQIRADFRGLVAQAIREVFGE